MEQIDKLKIMMWIIIGIIIGAIAGFLDPINSPKKLFMIAGGFLIFVLVSLYFILDETSQNHSKEKE